MVNWKKKFHVLKILFASSNARSSRTANFMRATENAVLNALHALHLVEVSFYQLVYSLIKCIIIIFKNRITHVCKTFRNAFL